MAGDVPRERLMDMAEQAIVAAGGPAIASVRFKFTCSLCGERCILREPNTLRERGECWRCGTETEIREGGFMLLLQLEPGS